MHGVAALTRRLRGGRHGAKRTDDDPLEAVQVANRAWWEQNPMTYDWRGSAALEPGSQPWFDDQDRRSDAQHVHFLNGRAPFELLLGDIALEGKEVLEIGIGSGYHAELLARQGARVTGIDLAAPSVHLSKARFAAKQLPATLEQWDAEQDRPDFHRRFDLIWSWGVIHHSAHTARIVRNAHGWLTHDGCFAGMVYHRDSMRLPVALTRDWLIGRNWRTHSIDEALCRSTDGFSARFYPADQWRDLLLAFFDEAQTSVQGLDVDAVPLPQPARNVVWSRLRPSARRRLLERLGHFLLFRADRPR
jgi:2-polyprenyl-3-methyl-5-hydroxy-6-metoxy-1,4-benzoquinol methylase